MMHKPDFEHDSAAELTTDDGLNITAYWLNRAMPMPIVHASQERQWMDETRMRFAYRCLPLLMANQYGWYILHHERVEAIWDGGSDISAIRLTYAAGPSRPHAALSHFGHGILTFSIPYLFRTPQGYNLMVRGPANMPKDGIQALDALVETDWSRATFTMNWIFTRPNTPVVFEAGEPVCMIYPVKRGEIEQFNGQVTDITHNSTLHNAYLEWSEARNRFNQDLSVVGSSAAQQMWQKDYFQGRTEQGRFDEHQTRLKLNDFKRDEHNETDH